MNDVNSGWQIIYRRKAKRILRRLPRDLQLRLRDAIDQLAVNPRPPGFKRLVSMNNLYRIRVGDWRIIYAIEEDQLLVLVVKVAPRGSAYRNL